MQELRIAFTDFRPDFTAEHCCITRVLRQRFAVNIIPADAHNPPHLLVYSAYGQTHLHFDCLSLFVADGDLLPDFNLCDYAIGPDALQLGDRYFQLSDCQAALQAGDLQARTAEQIVQAARLKTKFCAFYSMDAPRTHSRGEQFFDVLCAHERVDSGGSLRNNLGAVITDRLAWQQQYKFSIVFESSLRQDRITQAMLDALRADTVPIYWGNPQAGRFFNPARFINVHDYDSLAAAALAVRALHKDAAAYVQMLSQPWFAAATELCLPEKDPALCDFLYSIATQEADTARRVATGGLVPQYKAQLLRQLQLQPLLDRLQNCREGVNRQAQRLGKKFFSGFDLRRLPGIFRKKSDR